MNNAKIKSDSNGCFLEIEGNPPLYLKDAKGQITVERFPWIEKFLGVKTIDDGYELLYRLNKGGLAKWTINSSGFKYGFKTLKEQSIDDLQQEFQLDINCISQQEDEKIKQAKLVNKYYEKAKKYYRLGQHNKAEHFYYKTATLATNNYQFVNELATCLTLQSKLEEALEAYLYLAIKYPDRALNLSQFKIKLIAYINHHKDSIVVDSFIEIFERIASILKRRSHILNFLGELYWHKGEKSKALELKLLAANEKFLNRKKSQSLDIDSININKIDFKIPDFLIIAPQKSGTTALYQYLVQHPSIYPASLKEIFFFDLNYDFGLDWYKSHFPVLPEIRYLTGEASPTYFNNLQAPERIAESFPNVKLIFLIRDPVDRAISDYYMKVRNGVEKRAIEEAIIPEINFLQQESVDFLDPGSKFFKKNKGCVRNGLYFYFFKSIHEYF